MKKIKVMTIFGTRPEAESNAKIVIDTVFGEKTFMIKDIKSIKRVLENGETVDLNDILKL